MTIQPLGFDPYDFRDDEAGGTDLSGVHLLAMQLNLAAYAYSLTFGQLRSDTATDPATGVAVGADSVIVVEANLARFELIVTNDDDTDIVYLALGLQATLHAGIRLNPGGGSYKTTSYLGAVAAISTGTGILDITEV